MIPALLLPLRLRFVQQIGEKRHIAAVIFVFLLGELLLLGLFDHLRQRLLRAHEDIENKDLIIEYSL